MTEIWKPIEGYEGKYEISDHGRVRALYREGEYLARWGIAKMNFPAKMMKICRTPTGYNYVALSRDSVSIKYLIHRLVLANFIGHDERQCNHKDGDKDNNHIDNLEYCTPLQNLRHCIDVLGKKRGERMAAAKLKEADIPNIRSDKRSLRLIAADYGVSLQQIHHIKTRKQWGWLA
jgi:hypothetical protein